LKEDDDDDEQFAFIVTERTTRTGIAQSVWWLGYGTYDQGSVPSRDKDSSILLHVQAPCGAHPASCPVDTGSYLTGVRLPDT